MGISLTSNLVGEASGLRQSQRRAKNELVWAYHFYGDLVAIAFSKAVPQTYV
jgi:hypothetical protein